MKILVRGHGRGRGRGRGRGYKYIDLAKPKRGARVSLFASPPLY